MDAGHTGEGQPAHIATEGVTGLVNAKGSGGRQSFLHALQVKLLRGGQAGNVPLSAIGHLDFITAIPYLSGANNKFQREVFDIPVFGGRACGIVQGGKGDPVRVGVENAESVPEQLVCLFRAISFR